MNHPDITLAAVIGMPDPKWEERPLLLVKQNKEVKLSEKNIKDFLIEQVVKWWIPEKIIFVPDIPLTATGKINKLKLRKIFITD
jgi:fatty-acyl-CoA synthase